MRPGATHADLQAPQARPRPRPGRLAAAGLWLPLVTPFAPDGKPDLAALAALVRHLGAHGATGWVACGSTGEAAMLSAAEQDAVVATTLAAAAGQPVLAGLHGVRPEAVADQARHLAAQHPGLAGLLLTAPGYVRPSQTGIVRFFHTVAEASALPIVVYDIPARTGVRIEPATLLALAEHPQIQAVKDCSGDRAAAEAVLADGRLALLCGNDDELFDQSARGAVGAISAAAHVAPAAFAALLQAVARGDLPAARARWHRLAPLVRALFAEPNPAVIKAVLARQGHLQARLREPMLPASTHAAETAWRALQALLDEQVLVDDQARVHGQLMLDGQALLESQARLDEAARASGSGSGRLTPR